MRSDLWVLSSSLSLPSPSLWSLVDTSLGGILTISVPPHILIHPSRGTHTPEEWVIRCVRACVSCSIGMNTQGAGIFNLEVKFESISPRATLFHAWVLGAGPTCLAGRELFSRVASLLFLSLSPLGLLCFLSLLVFFFSFFFLCFQWVRFAWLDRRFLGTKEWI